MTHYDHDLQVQIVTNLKGFYPNPNSFQRLLDELGVNREKLQFNLYYLLELNRVRGDAHTRCSYPGISELPDIFWATAVGIEWLYDLDDASALDA